MMQEVFIGGSRLSASKGPMLIEITFAAQMPRLTT
jgi:hypothetical protein